MCDPDDVEAISGLLERIAGDNNLQVELAARGKDRLHLFGWASAAEELAGAIERVHRRAIRPSWRRAPRLDRNAVIQQGRFIRRTVESVLAQTYPNVEYFVVDGGSTDETLDVLRSSGTVSVGSRSPIGAVGSDQQGPAQADGEIVGYLNSDDVLLPDAIERSPTSANTQHATSSTATPTTSTGRPRHRHLSHSRLLVRTPDEGLLHLPAGGILALVCWRGRRAIRRAASSTQWTTSTGSDSDRGACDPARAGDVAQSRLTTKQKRSEREADLRRDLQQSAASAAGTSRSATSMVTGMTSFTGANEVPARMLRFSSVLRVLSVMAHYLWLNRRRLQHLSVRHSSLAAKRRILWRLKGTPRVFTLLLRARSLSRAVWLQALRQEARSSETPQGTQLRVNGYWPDNWVSDRLDVLIDRREHVRDLRIVGRPVAGMTLSVSAGAKQLGRSRITQRDHESVTVRLPAVPRELVTYAFSSHVVDEGGRRVAFLLEETNLFKRGTFMLSDSGEHELSSDPHDVRMDRQTSGP